MLTEAQANRVWEWMIEAEVRSFYFGDLAAKYSTKKQFITGASFFLASGAAATLAGKAPQYIPLIFSLLSAILTAYSMAVGLDKKPVAMSKLHYQWNQLAADYEQLWHHWREDGAESRLDQLLTRDREASQTGTLEAPADGRLIEKWQDRVYYLRGLVSG